MQALVIDDSRAMRMILRSVLTEIGFDVVEAASVHEAFQRLETAGHVDLALVDWNLPERPGLDFVAGIRAKEAYRGTRIIMVTTETEVGQMERAMACGADEYVMKPFTKDALRDKLRLVGLEVETGDHA
jgi:two-component system chemotaxis response regulator CheY